MSKPKSQPKGAKPAASKPAATDPKAAAAAAPPAAPQADAAPAKASGVVVLDTRHYADRTVRVLQSATRVWKETTPKAGR